jgi:AraC-like DNA-binding protein/DNA-directed RNA polymerase subunit N (RpoN/RPB10)
MLRVDVEPVSSAPFNAEATLRSLPSLRTVSCATSVGAHYDRTKQLVSDGDDSVGIVVNLGRKAVVACRGQELVLGPGDAVPILTQIPACLTATRHVGLLFPRAALASRISDIESSDVGIIPRGAESLRLLVSYIRAVRENAVLGTPGLRDAVVSHIYDLAALALGPHRAEDSLSAVTAARLHAALALIENSFSDPGLTAAEIARRQNISPRYLQRLIETTGKSFSTHLNELRLQRAYALLGECRDQTQRISEIALQAGFSDISHFNRLFRARFGETPSAVRADAKRIN